MDQSTPSTENPAQMEPTQKPNYTPRIVISAVLLLVIAGGSYYLGTQQSKSAAQTQITGAVPSISRAPTITDAPISTTEFQKGLLDNCEKYTEGNATGYYLDLAKAPITVNQDVIDIKFPSPGKLTCVVYGASKPQGFFHIPLQDNSSIQVYDASSDELGHGGAPFLGAHGTVVKEDTMKWTVYLQGNDGPTEVGTAPVMMRAQKSITSTGGQTFFVNYSKIAIPGNDPRLVAFLQPYSKPFDTDANKRQITEFPQEELKKAFFSDVSNLQGPEKEAMTAIETTLNAVSGK